MRNQLKLYYRLTKPGIIYANALTASGGFLLASKGQIVLSKFAAMLAGLSLVIASGCVINNYLDRDIDKLMDRTKKRALAVGEISNAAAVTYGLALGITGITLLGLFTNWWATGLALAGLVIYVLVYTPVKRLSVHGTLIGSAAGAVPPAVGYCAASGRFDLAAGLLILVLVFWQMPHFYSIAIYRRKDYAVAKIPVLPILKGNHIAKYYIAGYIAAFLAAVSMLSLNGYTGWTFLVVVLGAGLYWMYLALQGFSVTKDEPWAKRTFFQSLIVITVFSIVIGLNNWLP